ncbi:MAG: hypothetical protein Q4P84_00745 [Elusimicrobiales bacterium]|nr:hypothetical protein [Elusimicrobiales bacterium]
MKKPSFLHAAALFFSTALLSACAHTPKNTDSENLTFSFMGHTLRCQASIADDGTRQHNCQSSQLQAAFFEVDEPFIENPKTDPASWEEEAISPKYEIKKETFICSNQNYVTTIKAFRKGKEQKVRLEVLVHGKPTGLMFIEHKPQKNDFSILTIEAINDLCTRQNWILPEGTWKSMKYEDETEEENASNEL